MFKFPVVAAFLIAFLVDLMSCAIQPDCEVCTADGGACAVLNGPGHPKCLDKKTHCYTKIWLCDDSKNPDACSWQPYTYEKVNCRTCHGTCNQKAQTCVSGGKTRHFICQDIRTNCHWLENGKPDHCTAR